MPSKRAPASGPTPFKVVQISLGFDRAHPKVWDYFRNEGILFVSGNPSLAGVRLSLCSKDVRVMVYVPKSQGGCGVVGIGTVTGPPVMFEQEGQFLDDAVGMKLREHMKQMYSDAANEPTKSARCYNTKFERHRQGMKLATNGKNTTTWEYGQRRWTSDDDWYQKENNNNACRWHIPVKWNTTVPFEDGLGSIDWAKRRLCQFQFPCLASVMPRKVTAGHWCAIRSELRAKLSRAKLLGDVHTCVKKERDTLPPSTKRKAPLGTLGTGTAPSPAKVPRMKLTPGFATLRVSTMDEILASLGLSKYVAKFREEEIDLAALRLLKDCDLRALGLPMGPRRKLEAAIHTLASN